MIFKRLKESNIDSVVDLYMDYYNNFENGKWTYDTVYQRIHQVVTREDSYCLVIENDKNVMGFIMGYFEQYDDCKAYDLVEIVISSKFQRKGLGTLFMKELERRVKSLGAMLIQLQSVNDENHHKFYGKLGYNTCSNLVIKSKML